MFTSLPAAASISTPPALEVIAIAASSVPFVFTILISSFSAVSETASFIYKSSPAFLSVRSLSSATVNVIPPALDVSEIASLAVPDVLVIDIFSLPDVP